LNNPKLYNQYLGLATQMLVSTLVAFFAGKWIDKKFGFRFPVFILVLPLATLIATLYQIVKDTSKPK
jgi:F0F1-type ATP synthase assembly protein I